MRKSALFVFAPAAVAAARVAIAGDTKPGPTIAQASNQFGAPRYALTADGTEVTHG
jgi:hypothetical protein